MPAEYVKQIVIKRGSWDKQRKSTNNPRFFQVIAREDKGSFGIDYNRSPTIYLSLPSNSTAAAAGAKAVDEDEAAGLHQPEEKKQPQEKLEASEKRWKREMELLSEIVERLKSIEEKIDATVMA